MFGSKNKKQKSQVEVNIETMEGNLKGEGGKTTTIEYDKTGVNQGNKNIDTNKDSELNMPKKEEISNSSTEKAPFKSPFNGNDLPTDNTVAGKGTFAKSIDNQGIGIPNKQEVVLSNDIQNLKKTNENINTEGKDNVTFLHQSVDEKINNTAPVDTNKKQKAPSKKKGGINSFVLIILFIALLAGILLGGYYFYMNKDKNITTVEQKQVKKQPIDTVNNQKTINNKEFEQKKEVTVPKIEKFITSTDTFNNDLAKFIKELKQRRTAIDLQNGIFINPMISTDKALEARQLIEALHMINLFNTDDLKDSCKLFAIKDDEKIRVAVVFELSDSADEKLVKNKIIKGEQGLMKKMSYLFVDGKKPEAPANPIFAVNKNNMNARYANYIQGIDTSSVDWNIIDLGKGQLVYFATSRKTAKVLSEYFMRTVVK